MPHERSSLPVLPLDFSSIALADRKIRYRRELPLPDPLQQPLRLTSEQVIDHEELNKFKCPQPKTP